MIDDLLSGIAALFEWLQRTAYEILADVVEFFLGLVPELNLDPQAALNGWSGDVLYYLTIFRFDYALTVLFGAMAARFLLRRIPGIG